MRGTGWVLRRAALVALVGGAGIFGAGPAGAIPPPPTFWNFTISNSTGQDVVDVLVLLYAHVPDHYDQLNVQNPVRLTLSRIPSGSTITLGLPVIFGIGRISASGKCPAPSQASVTITGHQQDFVPGGGMEFAGFCPEAPTSPVGDYPPKLDFYLQNGQPRARLHAKSRWDVYYDLQPKVDDKAFQ